MRIGATAHLKLAQPIFTEWAPLLAIVFQLAVLALLTTRASSLEDRLGAYLPATVGPTATQAALRERVDITIQRVGATSGELAVTVGARKFAIEGVLGLDEVGRRLDELHRADPTLSATIQAGPGVLYDDVMRVLERTRDAGFEEVAFGVAQRVGVAPRSAR